MDKISGVCEKKMFGVGSKSEHEAVVVDGMKIRRAGVNAFVDPELEKWVGTFVTCEGTKFNDVFIADSIVVMKRTCGN